LIDQVKSLGELRVVTRSGPLSYYLGSDDAPQGPEYALARRFADELGVKLKITPVKSYEDMYAALNSGRAHLAAAGLKIPVKPIEGIEFGPTYQRVREHLIYRRGSVRPGSLSEIGNGDLEIAAGSSHAKALSAARDSLPDLVWVEDSTANSQALLEDVASGTIDYTIADSTEFAFAHAAHPELRVRFPRQPIIGLGDERPLSGVRAPHGHLFCEPAQKRRLGRDPEPLLRPFRERRVRRGSDIHAALSGPSAALPALV
jgi:membrane-bound lytic murein transglycosylase F